jgi:hypothetical protein
MRRRHAIALLGIGLSGCGGSSDEPESLAIGTVPQELRFAMGAIATGTYAITSWEGLAQVAATAAASPIPADLSRVPPVDFSRFMLLAVSYGVGGGCFAAEFVEARLEGDTITVTHRQIRFQGASGAACFGTNALTHYATIPLRAARVVFEALPPRFV